MFSLSPVITSKPSSSRRHRMRRRSTALATAAQAVLDTVAAGIYAFAADKAGTQVHWERTCKQSRHRET